MSGFQLVYAGFGGSGRRFVHCVLARISPVAVQAWPEIRAQNEVSCARRGMYKVGVGLVPQGPPQGAYRRPANSRCDGLLLLELLDSESMGRHAAEGMDIRYWALQRFAV